VPPDVIDAGQHLVNRLMGLFGSAGNTGTAAAPTDEPPSE